MSLDAFCELLKRLRVDRSGGRSKPYKPVMLVAVVLLIHKGKIRTPDVFLDGGLRSAFRQLLALLFPDWPDDPNANYPFRHLENDGIWTLVERPGEREQLHHKRAVRAEAWEVLRHVACARLDTEVFEVLATSFQARFRVIQLLSMVYQFDLGRTGRLWELLGDERTLDAASLPLPEAADAPLTERALEEHLERHWGETPFASMGVHLRSPRHDGLPGRQVLTPVNSIDLVGFQPRKRCWWIFELKRDRATDRVVGQVSRYLGWVKDQRAARKESAVGVIITRRVDPKLLYATRAHPGLQLWKYGRDFQLDQVA